MKVEMVAQVSSRNLTRVYWIGLDKWRAQHLAKGMEGSRVVAATLNDREGYAVIRGPANSLSWNDHRSPRLEIE